MQCVLQAPRHTCALYPAHLPALRPSDPLPAGEAEVRRELVQLREVYQLEAAELQKVRTVGSFCLPSWHVCRLGRPFLPVDELCCFMSASDAPSLWCVPHRCASF